ncbi:hypothetical protein AAF712_011390 [Marasmius tenuissimus]|uniref:Ubiquitin-like domain-containing protein n=1 Tax=Marasmius tenuissimus TaxID=585030 RepID=A0ABR2ZJG0_9AGAR
MVTNTNDTPHSHVSPGSAGSSSHHHHSQRRPSTSPGLPSSWRPDFLPVFVFDSPPIPGDPDYQGEPLPVHHHHASNEVNDDNEPSASILNSNQAQPTATETQTAVPLTDDSQQQDSSYLRTARSRNFNTPAPYSTTTSARTSYTRVDLALDSDLHSGEMDQENRNDGVERAHEQWEEQNELRSPEHPTTTTQLSEHPQSQQNQTRQLSEAQGSETQPTSTSVQPPQPQTPQVYLCFLLISGRRRVMSFEPETTVGRVKELAWNAWPGDAQDEQPPTPWHLRLLYLGKILQDDDTLEGLSFPIHTPTPPTATEPSQPPAPTIVHLSIRPFGPGAPTADDALKKKRKSLRIGIGRWGSTTGAGPEESAQRPSQPTGASVNADDSGRNGAGCCGGCIIS